MPRFSANLSMLYRQHAFIDRFSAAARDGFKAVEFAFAYNQDARTVARHLAEHCLRAVLLNAPPGDLAASERGLACLPGRGDAFRRSLLDFALPLAQALHCPRIHVMAGVAPPGSNRAELRRTYVQKLAWAAVQAATVGVELLMEPINPRDVPGYFLNRQDDTHAIVQEVGAANLKVQMDLYHCQIVEGDVTTKLRHYLGGGRVGHIQVAGVPGRHEPDGGELNWPSLFELIDELGYAGHVGAEYHPRGDTSAGLSWFAPFRPQPGDPS